MFFSKVDYQCSALAAVPSESSQEIMKRVCQGDAMEIDCGDLFIEVRCLSVVSLALFTMVLF